MTHNQKNLERGNVLFLILIAVALFAALSYAVTQSSRSGGGDATDETNAVNAASITQYPTGVRTAILRMTIDGTDVTTIEFNDPTTFGDCANAGEACVFHPSGGSATYQNAPSSAMRAGGTNTAGTWYYNSNLSITDVGTATSEFAAILPDITQGLCQELNDRYNITGVPTLAATASSLTETIADDTTTAAYIDPADESGTAQATAWPAGLDGQPFGCFENTTPGTNEYTYYHTLVER